MATCRDLKLPQTRRLDPIIFLSGNDKIKYILKRKIEFADFSIITIIIEEREGKRKHKKKQWLKNKKP